MQSISISEENLNNNDLYLWLINIDQFKQDICKLKNSLSDDLLAKINIIKIYKTKQLQIIRNAILTNLLGNYLNIEPNEVVFYYNKYNKPYLKNEINSSNSFFNVSYCRNYLLIGLSKNNEIGVDIEILDENQQYYKLIERFFSKQEQNYFLTLDKPRKLKEFYKYWTIKEAVIKCLGYGFFLPFQDFTVSLSNKTKSVKIDNKTVYYTEIDVSKDINVVIGIVSIKKINKIHKIILNI